MPDPKSLPSIDASPEDIAHAVLNAGVPDDVGEFEQETELPDSAIG